MYSNAVIVLITVHN